MIRRLSLLTAVSLLIVTGTSCGQSKQVCGPIVHDQLDPGSGTHVLPGAPTPNYVSIPPTSGAHQPGPKIEGPVRDPIALPLQVGVLEEGRIIIQYKDVSRDDVAKLEALNAADVVVAPAEKLSGNDRVVATAWVTRQSCSGVDVAALKAFVEARSGKGPGH